MEIREYQEILWRRKWLILLAALVTVIVAGLGAALQEPSYSASATVRVAQAASGSIEYVDYVYAERLMNTYTEILRSRPLLGEVIKRLDLSVTREELAKQIKAEVLLNTELLRVTVEDADPALARDIANVLASLLVEQGRSLYFGGGKSAREILQEQLDAVENNLADHRAELQELMSSQAADQDAISALDSKIGLEEEIYARLLVQYEEARVSEVTRANSVSIVESAVLPDEASSPRLKLYLALGLLAGLIIGVALAFLLESLAPALHSASDLEAAVNLPVLATIPRLRPSGKVKPGSNLADSVAGPGEEAYRILRTNVFFSTTAPVPKSLLVTSAEPGAGKSTVVAHLAAVLAQLGREVVVLDGDFRRPSLHEAFGVSNTVGLREVLENQCDLEQAVQPSKTPGLRVLATGRLPSNPTELLGSARLGDVLRQLAEKSDVVIVDSPPVLAVADAAVLAPQVDGVLLVAARDQVTAKNVQRAVQQVEKVGGRVIGLVFNLAEASYGAYYHAYGAGLATESAGQKRPASRKALTGALPALVALVAVALGGWLTLGGGAAWLSTARPTPAPAASPNTHLAAATTSTTLPQPAAAPPSVATARPTAQPMDAAASLQPSAAPAAAAAPIAPTTTLTSTLAPTSTPTQTPISSGVIPFRSSYLFRDPSDQSSGFMIVPANWRVEVLDDDVPGDDVYGSSRWYRVRVMYELQTYEGYVPSKLVEIER